MWDQTQTIQIYNIFIKQKWLELTNQMPKAERAKNK